VNDVDLLEKTLEEYKKARKLKQLNENLSIHLLGSIQYLLEYGKKYNMPIPKKEDLLRMIETGYDLVKELDVIKPSTENKQGEDQSSNEQNHKK